MPPTLGVPLGASNLGYRLVPPTMGVPFSASNLGFHLVPHTECPVKCLHLGTLHSGPGTMVPQTWYPRVWYKRVRYPVLGTQHLGPFIWYPVPGTQSPVKRFCSFQTLQLSIILFQKTQETLRN